MNLSQSSQDQQLLAADFGSSPHQDPSNGVHPFHPSLNYQQQSIEQRNLANQLAKQKLIDAARSLPRLTEANAPATYWAQLEPKGPSSAASSNGYNQPAPRVQMVGSHSAQAYPSHLQTWGQPKAGAWSASTGAQNQPAIVTGRWPAPVHYQSTIGVQPERGYTSSWRVAKHESEPSLGRRLRPSAPQADDVAELEPNPDEPLGPESSPNAADESAAQEPDYNGTSGAGTEEPQEEHEERAGRRSFSEDEEDASERDQLGRPVVTFHRHLINGVPVKRARSSGASRRPSRAGFEGVVDEIEGGGASDDYDDSPDESSGALGANPSESRIVGKRLKLDQAKSNSKDARLRDDSDNLEGAPKGSNRAKSAEISREDEIDDNSGEREPEKKHVEHKHDMKESLKAQQWDDDSAKSNPNGQPTEEAESSEDQNSDDSGEIQFEDLDLLANSNDDFMNRNEISRRKRRDTSQIRPPDSFEQLSNTSEPAMSSANVPSSQLRYGEQADANIVAPLGQLYNDHNWPTNHTSAGNEFGPNQPINIGLTAGTNGFYAPTTEAQPQSTTGQASGAPSALTYGAPLEIQVAPAPNPANSAAQHSLSYGPQFGGGIMSPFASGSVAKKKKKMKVSKKKKKTKKNEKVKYGKGHSSKKKAKLKHGGIKKKKHKAKRKMAKDMKMFQGSTKGNKGKKGEGHRGAKKGAIFYKDKGYKKKGFKKAYQKLESGDHKTYFDEYRDKNHNKNWKNFKDKHKFR